MPLQGVVFDLDGVITDTAEYHYRAWKRLADEEGLPFDREVNEQLRGVSRRQSLLIILDGRETGEAELEEMMARKNGYYQEMLQQVSPDDLLPGVLPLLAALDSAAIPYGIGSSSKNARTVVDHLGIAHRMAAIADGHSVKNPKPAPDLFLHAAEEMGVPADRCLVVEDAAAGVEAALAGEMPVLALGPAERFAELEVEVPRRDSLATVSLQDLRALVP
jgi:kojibiose phosphorylase